MGKPVSARWWAACAVLVLGVARAEQTGGESDAGLGEPGAATSALVGQGGDVLEWEQKEGLRAKLGGAAAFEWVAADQVEDDFGFERVWLELTVEFGTSLTFWGQIEFRDHALQEDEGYATGSEVGLREAYLSLDAGARRLWLRLGRFPRFMKYGDNTSDHTRERFGYQELTANFTYAALAFYEEETNGVAILGSWDLFWFGVAFTDGLVADGFGLRENTDGSPGEVTYGGVNAGRQTRFNTIWRDGSDSQRMRGGHELSTALGLHQSFSRDFKVALDLFYTLDALRNGEAGYLDAEGSLVLCDPDGAGGDSPAYYRNRTDRLQARLGLRGQVRYYGLYLTGWYFRMNQGGGESFGYRTGAGGLEVGNRLEADTWGITAAHTLRFEPVITSGGGYLYSITPVFRYETWNWLRPRKDQRVLSQGITWDRSRFLVGLHVGFHRLVDFKLEYTWSYESAEEGSQTLTDLENNEFLVQVQWRF